MFNNLPFGSVVKVKSMGRHDTGYTPYAVTLSEGSKVWLTNKTRYYAMFVDQTRKPREFSFAKLYSDEIQEVLNQLDPIKVAQLQSDADELRGR